MKEEILKTASRLNNRGEQYMVHKYKYRAEKKMRHCADLVNQGKLIRAGTYRDEVGFIVSDCLLNYNAAVRKQELRMAEIYKNNIVWHQKYLDGVNGEYHRTEIKRHQDMIKNIEEKR